MQCRSLIGWIGAGVGLVGGGAAALLGWRLWPLQPMVALGPLCVAQLLFMYLVADRLCPHANPAVTRFLKLSAILVLIPALTLSAYILWGEIRLFGAGH